MPATVIALRIDFLPFALSLSKGELPIHGSTSSPRTGLSFIIQIIFSFFVVLPGKDGRFPPKPVPDLIREAGVA
jgi:hypothetical protein